MIRFLNLKDQICEGSNNFAFYDTISNTICSFGMNEEEVFSSVESFQQTYNEELKGTRRPMSRFINLIPDDYFACDIKTKHNMEKVNKIENGMCCDCEKKKATTGYDLRFCEKCWNEDEQTNQ